MYVYIKLGCGKENSCMFKQTPQAQKKKSKINKQTAAEGSFSSKSI